MANILVVGAGPVGLTLAAELARYGIGVRLIDRSPRATETSKALVVWSRTLELMDRMGCTGGFLEAGLRAHGASIRSGGAVLGRPRFDDVASAYNFALMIPQRETERLLAVHLRCFGAEVERQVELVGAFEAADGVEARLRHADGREETVRTPWLIGCDGAHSTVRHGLGFAFSGSTQGDDWLLADVRLEGAGAPAPDEIATYLHRDGPFVVFPIPGGRARVVATRGRTDPARPDPTLADVQAMIDRWAGGTFRAADPVWLTNFRINERKVAEYRRGRIFLAGDAAHIHSPAGGQGMNTGMQDAFNLAWKLAMVIGGRAAPALLDSYSPERSAVGDRVLRNAGRVTDAAIVRNPVIQDLRNTVVRFAAGFPLIQHKIADMLAELDIGYPQSPLSVTGHHFPQGPKVGERWPKPLQAGSRAAKFTAIGPAEIVNAIAAKFPSLVVAEPESTADHALRLVRPDGYVGFAGTAADHHRAEAYLITLAA